MLSQERIENGRVGWDAQGARADVTDGLNRSMPVRLLWMDEASEPSTEQFDNEHSDPAHGPERWFVFEMAVAYAMNLSRTDGLVPWIKLGNEIIGPQRLRELYGSRAAAIGDAAVFPDLSSSPQQDEC